jgi:hypothetical protein
MTPEQHDLYERIQAFAFDEGKPELPFSARLSKDNGWPKLYSLRVVEEYRKFAFLMAAADHMAVPSDQIDQAWHQHLQYTRSWADFCRNAMRQTIDHEPTRGGCAETDRFKDLYERTLASYGRFFGEPPEDIWPRAALRFGRDLHFRRVNTATNLVISRSQLLQLGLAALVILGAAVVAWMS